ncbi:MAG: hypothetical protein SFV15_18965 [Polyangiaceae bacterium]|nr:hypothetical protein [Polyangiaceae bacterium]
MLSTETGDLHCALLDERTHHSSEELSVKPRLHAQTCASYLDDNRGLLRNPDRSRKRYSTNDWSALP